MEDEEPEEKNGVSEETTHPEINVGVEHVQKVEVYYCDLCRYYLPRKDEVESVLLIKHHCASRPHLRSFVRYRNDQQLRLEAERIHRKRQEKKEATQKGAAVIESGTAKKASSDAQKLKEDEDKMSDEEKDVSEVLQQANYEDDEDSRINSER